VEHLAALAERGLDEAPQLVLGLGAREASSSGYGSTTMTALSTAGDGSNAAAGP
jgi:hypothetical protein